MVLSHLSLSSGSAGLLRFFALLAVLLVYGNAESCPSITLPMHTVQDCTDFSMTGGSVGAGIVVVDIGSMFGRATASGRSSVSVVFNGVTFSNAQVAIVGQNTNATHGLVGVNIRFDNCEFSGGSQLVLGQLELQSGNDEATQSATVVIADSNFQASTTATHTTDHTVASSVLNQVKTRYGWTPGPKAELYVAPLVVVGTLFVAGQHASVAILRSSATCAVSGANTTLTNSTADSCAAMLLGYAAAITVRDFATLTVAGSTFDAQNTGHVESKVGAAGWTTVLSTLTVEDAGRLVIEDSTFSGKTVGKPAARAPGIEFRYDSLTVQRQGHIEFTGVRAHSVDSVIEGGTTYFGNAAMFSALSNTFVVSEDSAFVIRNGTFNASSVKRYTRGLYIATRVNITDRAAFVILDSTVISDGMTATGVEVDVAGSLWRALAIEGESRFVLEGCTLAVNGSDGSGTGFVFNHANGFVHVANRSLLGIMDSTVVVEGKKGSSTALGFSYQGRGQIVVSDQSMLLVSGCHFFAHGMTAYGVHFRQDHVESRMLLEHGSSITIANTNISTLDPSSSSKSHAVYLQATGASVLLNNMSTLLISNSHITHDEVGVIPVAVYVDVSSSGSLLVQDSSAIIFYKCTLDVPKPIASGAAMGIHFVFSTADINEGSALVIADSNFNMQGSTVAPIATKGTLSVNSDSSVALVRTTMIAPNSNAASGHLARIMNLNWDFVAGSSLVLDRTQYTDHDAVGVVKTQSGASLDLAEALTTQRCTKLADGSESTPSNVLEGDFMPMTGNNVRAWVPCDSGMAANSTYCSDALFTPLWCGFGTRRSSTTATFNAAANDCACDCPTPALQANMAHVFATVPEELNRGMCLAYPGFIPTYPANISGAPSAVDPPPRTLTTTTTRTASVVAVTTSARQATTTAIPPTGTATLRPTPSTTHTVSVSVTPAPTASQTPVVLTPTSSLLPTGTLTSTRTIRATTSGTLHAGATQTSLPTRSSAPTQSVERTATISLLSTATRMSSATRSSPLTPSATLPLTRTAERTPSPPLTPSGTLPPSMTAELALSPTPSRWTATVSATRSLSIDATASRLMFSITHHAASTTASASGGTPTGAATASKTVGPTPSISIGTATASASTSASARTVSQTGSARSASASASTTGSANTISTSVPPTVTRSGSRTRLETATGSFSHAVTHTASVSLTVPLRVRAPPAEFPDTSPQEAVVGSTATTAALVNPAVATQSNRLAFLRLGLSCTDDDDDDADADGDTDGDGEPLEWSMHPLSFPIDAAGQRGRFYAGAILGNFALMVAVSLAHVVLAGGFRRIAHQQSALRDCLAWARWPGLSFFIIPLLIEPTAAGAFVLVVHGSGAGWRALGAIAGVVCLLIPVAMLAVFRLRFPRVLANVPRRDVDAETDSVLAGHHRTGRKPPPPGSSDTGASHTSPLLVAPAADEGANAAAGRTTGPQRPSASKQSTIAWLLYAGNEWVALDPRDTDRLLQQYGALFEPYNARAPWFLVIELALSVASGFAGGVVDATGCMWSAWMVALLFVLFLVALVVIRPFEIRFDFGFMTLLASLQAGGAIAAAATHTGAPGARIVAEILLDGVVIVATALGVYEIVKAVVSQVQLMKRRRVLTAAQERRTHLLVDMGHNDDDDSGHAAPLPIQFDMVAEGGEAVGADGVPQEPHPAVDPLNTAESRILRDAAAAGEAGDLAGQSSAGRRFHGIETTYRSALGDESGAVNLLCDLDLTRARRRSTTPPSSGTGPVTDHIPGLDSDDDGRAMTPSSRPSRADADELLDAILAGGDETDGGSFSQPEIVGAAGARPVDVDLDDLLGDHGESRERRRITIAASAPRGAPVPSQVLELL